MLDSQSTSQPNSAKQNQPTPTIDPLAAKANTTVAYTDGACKGNPGAGGWGAHLIFSDGRTQDLYGGEDKTTNNRMELMGAIKALQHSSSDQTLEIWTDSSYVKKGFTEWLEGWKKRGWKTASKKPVANQDLWQQLDALCDKRQVDWHWVKGHAGHLGNEKADELANLGVTSNSEPSAETTQSEITKKKDLLMANNENMDSKETDLNKSSAVNDWLTFDPLGLDIVDEALEEEEVESDGLESDDAESDDVENNIALEQHDALNQVDNNANIIDANIVDDNIAAHAVEYTQHLDSVSKPMRNPVMSISQPSTTESTTPESTTINTVENIITKDSMTHTDSISKIAPETPKFDGDTSRANPYFEPLLPKPIHKNESNRQLIMDTETTGLDPLKGDRVIEVGIVEMVGRKFTGEKLHVYINPQRGMDEEVIRIHGISEAFLTDKPTFDVVAQSLYEFMDGAEIIAHNATFDMNFLNMEFAKVGLNDFADRVKVTDSLTMAKQQYPGQKNTLDALVRRLNVGKQDRTFHGALLDSEILAEVYLAMTGGQVTLAIEDDIKSDGGAAVHANFAHLAALVLESSVDESANQKWFATLAEDYPEIKAKIT